MKWQKSFNVLLLLALLLAAALPTATPTLAQSTQVPSKESVKEVMARVNKYWMQQPPDEPEDVASDREDWKRAVYFTGDWAHYRLTEDATYADFARTWATGRQWALYPDCQTVYADMQAAAQTYLALYEAAPQDSATQQALACVQQSVQESMTWGWVEIDLGAVQSIREVRVHPFLDRAYRFLVQVKTAADAPYQTVVNRHDNRESAPVLGNTFAPVQARYVRLWVLGAYGYFGSTIGYPNVNPWEPTIWVSIREFEVYDELGQQVALQRPALCSSEPEANHSCQNVVDGDTGEEGRWSASLFSPPIDGSSPYEGLYSKDWWWIDAMYMAMPVYAKLSKITGDPTYLAGMYTRYSDAKDNRALYDPAAGLWYRDEDYIYPRRQTANFQKVFWSRGNGWVFAALARTLSEMTPSSPHYDEYLATFRTMAAAIEAAQHADGYWNSSLADPAAFPGPESSGTAFFTYGLAWGINNRLLDAATYEGSLLRAWQWLATSAVHPDGKVGYVQLVGQEPGAAAFDDTEEYGVGAFLLAGSEVYKLAGDEPVAPNLALNKPVVCSSVPEPENPCAHVVNGNLIDRWSATPYPQWVEVDLGAIYVIDTVKVHPFENRAYQYVVEGKATAAGGYVTLVDRTANTQGGSVLADHVAGIATRYVRLRVVGASGYEGAWVSLREWELFGQATVSVNALLSVQLRNLAYNPQPVANAPAGVFTIGANFKNKSTTPIKHLFFQVTTLTDNNLLLNADGGPGGVGAILAVPGELASQATATANFQIGLQRRLPFLFFVKAYGVLPAGVMPAEVDATAAELDLSITSTALDEATTTTFTNQSYLPLIVR